MALGALIGLLILGDAARAQSPTDISLRGRGAEDLLSRVAVLEQANHALSERLSQAEQSLARMEAATMQPPDQGAKEYAGTALAPFIAQVRDQRLALALLQLGIATRTHQPFVRELDVVRQLGVEESRLRIPIDSLTPHAATGVATVAELRDSFGLILLPKFEAIGHESGPSWTRQAWTWLSIVGAPAQQPTPSSPAVGLGQELVRSAMDRLSEDDLQGAVELIAQLDGAPASLAARWLMEANARLSLDSAYEGISRTILALLNRASPP